MKRARIRRIDDVCYDTQTNRVTITKVNGNTYTIASYNDAHRWHKRGAFVVGGVSYFKVSRRTKARALKYFYPDDSLTYLEKYGYIAY
jgi:hypothetical protein